MSTQPLEVVGQGGASAEQCSACAPFREMMRFVLNLGLRPRGAAVVMEALHRARCDPGKSATCPDSNRQTFFAAAAKIRPALVAADCDHNVIAAFLMGLCRMIGRCLPLVGDCPLGKRCMGNCGTVLPAGPDWLTTVGRLQEDLLDRTSRSPLCLYLSPSVAPLGITVRMAADVSGNPTEPPTPYTGFTLPLDKAYDMAGVIFALFVLVKAAVVLLVGECERQERASQPGSVISESVPIRTALLGHVSFRVCGCPRDWAAVFEELVSWCMLQGFPLHD